MFTLSINQLTVQLTIVQRNVNYQTMILQVSYKSSSIILTANYRISSAFPFKQHANPLTIYLRIMTLSINQLTIQLTIVHRYQQQYIILLFSHNQSAVLLLQITQLVQHPSNHNAITLSINQLTVQTDNCSKQCQLPNHDLASLLQIKHHYIDCKWQN